MRRFSILIAFLLLPACGDSGSLNFDGFGSAREAVLQYAVDPSSVEFRNLERCGVNKEIVSGEFNEKNRYGGYEGFKTFLYDTKSQLLHATTIEMTDLGKLSNGMTAYQIASYEKLAPLCYTHSEPNLDFLYRNLEPYELELIKETRTKVETLWIEARK